MIQDTSKDAEKVTPDSKFSKSFTSSSLTSSASTEKDDPTVCNLESRLDAAALADPSGGVCGKKFAKSDLSRNMSDLCVSNKGLSYFLEFTTLKIGF